MKDEQRIAIVKNATARVRGQRKEIEQLRAELEANKAVAVALQVDIKHLRAENAETSTAVGDLRHALNVERIENTELHNRIAKLEDENAQHERDLEHLRGERLDDDIFAEQNEKLKAENAELRRVIAEGDFKDVYAEGIEMGKRLAKGGVIE